MKKKNILILLVISMLFCISSVKAKKFTCEYEYPGGGGKLFWANSFSLTFILDESNKYNTYQSDASEYYNPPIITDFDIEGSNVQKYIEEKLVNNGEYTCVEKVYVCDTSNGSPNSYATNVFVALTMDGYSYMMQRPGSDGNFEIPIEHEGNTFYLDECEWYDYAGDKKTVEFENVCVFYSKNMDELKDAYKENKYIEYNKKKDELVTFCQNVISNSNYEIEDGKVNNCYSSCLKINNEIAGIENLNGGEKTCGFSQRLIVWVGNIIKWIKYIIPVIVIILGIIDFIKAIASSSDDEMKKAQGRFIKRLVAAALIFIIPFIIEFILDKTGFSEYVSGCGVIDL